MARAIGTRVERLHAVTGELASALEAGRIAEILIDHGVEAVEARTGALYVVDSGSDHARLLRSVGYPDDAQGRFGRVPLDAAAPLADAIRDRRPVLLGSRAEYARRFPASEERSRSSTAEGVVAIACVPLVEPGGSALGGLAFAFEGERAFGGDEAAFLALLAHHGTQALLRARLFHREKAAARQAEEASRLKDEFLATVSHELRTPLAAILSWSQTLHGERRLDAEHVQRAAQVIDRNARAQLRLVEDLLDVSRIIRGQLRIDAVPVELEPIVRDVVDGMRPSAEARRIEVALDLEPSVRLVGDPDRLRQIVWNLLSNALKFTSEGGHVGVRVAQEGARVSIVVHDTGRGIDPDFLPQVFDRFSQADRGPSRPRGGLGLGLAIVRHLVEMHGGTVAVRSEGVGRGATFEVALPVKPFAAEPRATPDGDPVPDARAGGDGPLAGVRVLVVEDEPDSRELIEVLLANEGAVVEPTASAEEALARLDAFDPHLLVSDIGMPRHDGTWLIARVRESRPALPAIALTAFTRREDVDRILAAGFDHHVGKPVDPDRLVALAARVSGRSGPPPVGAG